MKLRWGSTVPNPNLPLLISWKTKGGDALSLKRSGVFLIRNEINGKIYVGYTGNLEARYKLMSYLLANNLFGNVCRKLQVEYNLYKRDNISFTPREICMDRKITYLRWLHISNFYRNTLGEGNIYTFDFDQLRSKVKDYHERTIK